MNGRPLDYPEETTLTPEQVEQRARLIRQHAEHERSAAEARHRTNVGQAALMSVAMHIRVARLLDDDFGAGFAAKHPAVAATLTQAAVALQIHAENEERHTDLLCALQRLEG